MEDDQFGKEQNEISSSNISKSYWNTQYDNNTTRWDLGQISPPIKEYIDQLTNKDLRILIPGCGNSYEAAYLLQQGFTAITVIDIAPTLVEKLQQKFLNTPAIQIVEGDFFKHKGTYDLVLEQTFFCAIDPLTRPLYLRKMKEILVPGGKIAGILFGKEFEDPGPPFGGIKEKYQLFFGQDFLIKTMEPCYNSFVKRQGTELFINLVKK